MFEDIDKAMEEVFTWIVALVVIPGVSVAVWLLNTDFSLSIATVAYGTVGAIWGWSVGLFILRTKARGINAFISLFGVSIIAMFALSLLLVLFFRLGFTLPKSYAILVISIIMSSGLSVGAAYLKWAARPKTPPSKIGKVERL